MIQVLIVDDDIHSTEGVQQAVPWEELGVTGVLTANSMAQAERVMEETEIDILFLDIEMPKGSGFDLLKLLAEKERDIVVIMLTSYASFDYAKRAIAFQCLDYLLKPSSVEELTHAARRAVEEVLRKRSRDTDHRLALYWHSNSARRLSMFWRAMLSRPEHFSEELPAEIAAEMKVEFDPDLKYLPLLVQFFGELTRERFSGFENDFLSAAMSEGSFEDNRIVCVENENGFLLIRAAGDDFVAWTEHFRASAAAFLKKTEKERGEKAAAYLGSFGTIGDVVTEYIALSSMSRDNVSERTGVFQAEKENDGKDNKERKADIAGWTSMIFSGNLSGAEEAFEWFLREGTLGHYWNRERLIALEHELLNGCYAACGEREIPADLLTRDHELQELYPKARESVEGFRQWGLGVFRILSEAAAGLRDNEQIVKKAKSYIREHISEDIGRDDIATACALSPDYVSRIFRQETGKKMSEYITEKRMEKARQFLLETDLTVSEVADRCGYANLAYFSKVFRIRNGKTPAEFRAAGERGI